MTILSAWNERWRKTCNIWASLKEDDLLIFWLSLQSCQNHSRRSQWLKQSSKQQRLHVLVQINSACTTFSVRSRIQNIASSSSLLNTRSLTSYISAAYMRVSKTWIWRRWFAATKSTTRRITFVVWLLQSSLKSSSIWFALNWSMSTSASMKHSFFCKCSITRKLFITFYSFLRMTWERWQKWYWMQMSKIDYIWLQWNKCWRSFFKRWRDCLEVRADRSTWWFNWRSERWFTMNYWIRSSSMTYLLRSIDLLDRASFFMCCLFDFNREQLRSSFRTVDHQQMSIITVIMNLIQIQILQVEHCYDSSYASMLIAMWMTMLMTMFLTIVDRSSLDYRVVLKSILFRISLCFSESYR